MPELNLPTSTQGIGRWRPQCDDCSRFVPMANYRYYHDWESGYGDAEARCSPGTGCRKDEARALSTKDTP